MARVVINVGGIETYTEDLRKRLKRAGISQNQLAKEMGVPPSILSRWFNSPIKPNMTSVEKIETALIAIVRKREREKAAHRRKVARTDGA